MKFLFTTLCFLLALPPTAQAEAQFPSFKISSDQVVSWKDSEAGVSVKVTQSAGDQFCDFSKANIDQPIQIFFEDTLLSSVIVREPICGDSFMFAKPNKLGNPKELFPKEKQAF